MKAAVKAKPSPNCSMLGKAAPTNAPPAVETVHTLISMRPDPIRKEAPTLLDLARSDIVNAQFSSPVTCIAKSLVLRGRLRSNSDNYAMIPI